MTLDLEKIKARQQTMWAAGDYSVVGATVLIVAEELCEAVDLRAGSKVLDVATGSGNAALAAARRWCEVTGCDYVPALLERGRERAKAERLPVTFVDGDAEKLPLPDASFDYVLSTFGAMFAPDQDKAAGELLRVCRPGGKIGMANWTPDSLPGDLLRINAKYIPPPPGLKPPVRWGTEEGLKELFGKRVKSLATSRKSFMFRYLSAEHYLDIYRRYFGPTVRSLEALGPEQRSALEQDVRDMLHRRNRSGDSSIAAPGDYLEVVAVRA